MSSQAVYRLQERTGHDKIKRTTEAVPVVDKHEVLIKIRALSLNYRDIGVADGTYPFPVKDSVVPCSDASGDIVEVGSSVNGFKTGDRVVINFDATHMYGPALNTDTAHGGAIDGFLREYAAVPAEAVVKIPEESPLDYSELASLVCTGVTAWNAMFGLTSLKPGQSVLFQRTGGVSITGLLIAKAAGAVTFITSSSDEKLTMVKEKYGVDHVINYKKTPDWAAEVNKLTGRGVDYILENGGSGTIEQSLNAITPGGLITVIGFLARAKQEDMPDVASLVLAKNCIVRGVLIGPKHLLEDLVRFVVSKSIKPPVEKIFGFSPDEIVRAFDYLKSGGHVGKVCIKVE